MDDKTRATILNPNQSWTLVMVLMTTPSITVGVNFNLDHFDQLFVYASRYSCCPRDVLQMTMRVRRIADNVMYLYVVHTFAPPIAGAPTTTDAVLKEKHARRDLIAGGTRWKGAADVECWLERVLAANEAEENVKATAYEHTLLKYLESTGYTVHEFLDASVDPVTLAAAEVHHTDYGDIPDFPSDGYARIFSGAATRLEKLAHAKKQFADWPYFASIDPRLFHAVWMKPGGKEKLLNCHFEKVGDVEYAVKRDVRNWGLAIAADGLGKKLEHVLAIKSLLCPEAVNRLICEDDIIPAENVKRMATYMAEHEKELNTVFGITYKASSDTDRDATWAIRMYNRI